MSAAVFVDTNVLLYARDPRDAGKHARANDWLEHLWRERRGRTSMQVVSEYYVNLTRKLHDPPAQAWEAARLLLAWRPAVADDRLLARAYEVEQRYRLGWWDSLMVAAAQVQECGILLTEDMQDGQAFGTVTVRSPFTLEANEPHAQYASAVNAVPRHRPRGRPKRRVAAAT